METIENITSSNPEIKSKNTTSLAIKTEKRELFMCEKCESIAWSMDRMTGHLNAKCGRDVGYTKFIEGTDLSHIS